MTPEKSFKAGLVAGFFIGLSVGLFIAFGLIVGN